MRPLIDASPPVTAALTVFLKGRSGGLTHSARHVSAHFDVAGGYGLLMTERVEPTDIGMEWESNAPMAVMATNDAGLTALALQAHFDDSDRRSVVPAMAGYSIGHDGGPER